MAVTITCPHCGAAGNAPDNIVGQTVRCSKCKQSFVAGGSAPPPPPLVPAPAPPPVVEDYEEVPPARRARGGRDDYDDDYEPRRPPIRHGAMGSSPFVDFLLFRRMIAPLLIMVIFWVLVIFVVVADLIGMVGALSQGGMTAVLGLLIGLVMLVVGPLGVRVFCEALIVQFRISETLTDIKNVLESRQ